MNTISLKNVCIDFPIFNSSKLSLRNAIVDKLGGFLAKEPNAVPVVRALHNINLEAKAGDRIGLVGHNGSGKSTLLRTIAGIYTPTAGLLEAKGTISTLFGTGVGLYEEMTGYENLFLSALIFGGDYRKAKESLPALAEFTGLGNYLELPMRTYSDGMKVRIGFAAATNFVPDILLIDEVFGAGDREFADKANNKIIDLIQGSNTLFLASHSDDIIKRFCNKAIFMSKGEILEYGPVGKVLEAYNSLKP